MLQLAEVRRRPSARVHDPASPEGPAKQTYAYDPNGNRTLDERGIHTYNARSQLVKWQRAASSGPGSAPAGQSYADPPGPMQATGSTTYSLDGTGQTLMRTDSLDYKAKLEDGRRPPVHEDSRARYRYENGSLSQVVANTDKNVDFNEVDLDTKTRTTTDFSRYDDLGNVRRIESETTSLTPGTPDPDDQPLQPGPSSVPGCAAEIADWSASNTTFHCFDPFGRLVATRAPKPESQSNPNPTLSYIYDGLDRRDVGLKKQGTEATVTTSERTYVGTSELLSREARPGGGVDSRTYTYDSQGLRLGAQVDRGQTSPRFDAYSHDANGSVVGIEDSDTGEIADSDRYLYDPYGALLDTDPGDAQSAEGELSSDAQANPFRFEGFYYDSGIQSYDMQAREYRPDIGAFLSQDRFEAAGADLALQSDPLTQNRYAFAGGNPVSRIEFDGHCAQLDAWAQDYCPESGGDGSGGGSSPSGGGSAAPTPLPAVAASAVATVATVVAAVKAPPPQLVDTPSTQQCGPESCGGHVATESGVTPNLGISPVLCGDYPAAPCGQGQPLEIQNPDPVRRIFDPFVAPADIPDYYEGGFGGAVRSLGRLIGIGGSVVSRAKTPGGGLIAHEGGEVGGHTILKHVGKSVDDLRVRLAQERGIPAASSFSSVQIADESVGAAIAANRGQVDALLTQSPGARVTLNTTFSNPVGTTLTRGSVTPTYSNSVSVTLQRTDSSLGYQVLTAFPK